MGVGTDNGPVHVVDFPVDAAFTISLLLDLGEDVAPDTGLTPAVEPTGDRADWPVAFRQIAPWRTGANNPENAIDDAPVVGGWSPSLRLLGRQQWLDFRPLVIG